MLDPDRVNSRHDLARFVSELAKDLRAHPDRWENLTLDGFLEAMAGWINDMEGWFANRGETEPQQPDWQLVAWILRAAAIYE